MGPCIIQPFHEPHCPACCCIQETMSSHQAIPLPSLTPAGLDALHSWHDARIAPGDAHMPDGHPCGPTSTRPCWYTSPKVPPGRNCLTSIGSKPVEAPQAIES